MKKLWLLLHKDFHVNVSRNTQNFILKFYRVLIILSFKVSVSTWYKFLSWCDKKRKKKKPNLKAMSTFMKAVFKFASIVCIWVSTISPQKPPPTKSVNCPSPLSRHPLKIEFFTEPPQYYIFSSLTPSYFLKISKFLVKTSQFNFLLVKEKNIFCLNLFCH